MAVFTGSDLRLWRESQKITAADLAERISVDATTIYRYESGKLTPNPDVMYEICSALGDVDKWTTWMRTEFPASYGRVHPETAPYSLPGALMALFAEMRDVHDLEREALRDGATGSIDDPAMRDQLEKEVTEMIQAAQRVRSLMKGGVANGKSSDG